MLFYRKWRRGNTSISSSIGYKSWKYTDERDDVSVSFVVT